MKQAFAESIGNLIVREVEKPEPGPNEVRVATLLAGICGSDLHAVAGQHPLLYPQYVPGHEAVGVVDALGPGVTSPAVGTRVLLKPNLQCGECVNCLAGRDNACQVLAWVGCDPSGTHPGAMADYFLVRPSNLFAVPDDVSDEQAALVEPLATPMHAARIAGDLSGAKVVVMGAGSIGILMLVAALSAGAAAVVVTDLDSSKRDRAVRLGAVAAVDGASATFTDEVLAALDGPADVIFDCVAMEVSARQWTSIVRRAATIVIVGVPPRDFVVPMPLIQDWELRVQGSAAYTESDIKAALAAGGSIPVDEIVSGVFPLSESTEAFEAANQPTSGKVLLRPDGSAA